MPESTLNVYAINAWKTAPLTTAELDRATPENPGDRVSVTFLERTGTIHGSEEGIDASFGVATDDKRGYAATTIEAPAETYVDRRHPRHEFVASLVGPTVIRRVPALLNSQSGEDRVTVPLEVDSEELTALMGTWREVAQRIEAGGQLLPSE